MNMDSFFNAQKSTLGCEYRCPGPSAAGLIRTRVCLELNVPSLFAVGANPGDPRLRADIVPQGPKQSSYLRNRPVMRLRRPAMSVARESMVRILVVVKFLACTPGARTNPRHWKAQCQAKEGTPLLHMPLLINFSD